MQITQFSKQNNRPYQEDRSFIKIMKTGVLLGVFDGHGGEEVSDFCADNTVKIFNHISKEIKKDPEETLKQLVKKLDEKTNYSYCGSTAAIVLIKNNEAHVSILGDSGVLIKTSSGSLWQSPEHNVRTNAKECDEAKARGGWVDTNRGYLFDRNVYNGQGLQMSRALGDRELSRVLNREPEIFHIPINKTSWILVYSDGLIDPSHANQNAVIGIVKAIETLPIGAEELVHAVSDVQNNDNSTAILARME